MPKGQKSSTTSGTRKKNARKAAQATQASSSTVPSPSPVPKPPKSKTGKGGKLSKREAREQRKKVYIPPTKPAPPVPDPLDTTGLAHLLPPELVVVLRSLGKKDAVTRGKAIEELARWVEDAIKEQTARDRNPDGHEEGEKVEDVVKMLPVWLHRAPVLFTHPARRIRHLAASLQASLLRLNPAREAFLAWTNEIASQAEFETLLGTWAMLAQDIDRGVTTVGMRSWGEIIHTPPTSEANGEDAQLAVPPKATESRPGISLTPHLLTSLLKFAHQTVLDPQNLHTALNPTAAPVSAFPSPAPQSNKGAQSGKGASQGKGTPLGKAAAQGKKGSPSPQPQQKKSGRYVPPSPDPSSQTSLSQSDRGTEDNAGEESESDRAGRLRVGALGVIRWIVEKWLSIDSALTETTILTPLLSSTAFWSTLHPGFVAAGSSSTITQQACPYSAASFGNGQPQVRRAAWALVGSLVRVFHRSLPEQLLRILCTAVLRSAWVETDIGVRAALGASLGLFLKDYSQAWVIDKESSSRGYSNLEPRVKDTEGDESGSESDSESDSHSESEEENDSDVDVTDTHAAEPSANGQLKRPSQISPAYSEFLQFLELGCSGSPVEGYPLVLIVLSGMPDSILPTTLPHSSPGVDDGDKGIDIHPITQLLTSFWAPVDSGLLDRDLTAKAWLDALTECLVLFVRRAVHSQEFSTQTSEDAKSLLASQFSRIWVEIATNHLRLDQMMALTSIVTTEVRLKHIGQEFFDAVFDAVFSSMLAPVQTSQSTSDLAPEFLALCEISFLQDSREAQKLWIAVFAYMRWITEGLESAVNCSDQTSVGITVKEPLSAFFRMVTRFTSRVFVDESVTSRIDAVFLGHSVELLRVSPQSVILYLRWRSFVPESSVGEPFTQNCWKRLLDRVASSPTGEAISLLGLLLGSSIPTHLKGASGSMDELVERLVNDTIAVGGQNNEAVVGGVLSSPASFLSSVCIDTIASVLSSRIASFAEERVRFAGISGALDDVPDLSEIGPAVGLVVRLVGLRRKFFSLHFYKFTGDDAVELYAALFLIAYVIPGEGSSGQVVDDAKKLWNQWISKKLEEPQIDWELREMYGSPEGDGGRDTRENLEVEREMREIAVSLVKERLRTLIVDDKAETRPESIIRCITPSPPGLQIDPLTDILPSREEFNAMLDSDALPSTAASSSLALLNPILPTCSTTPRPVSSACRKYGRAVSALLAYLSSARTVARSNLWALRHILSLGFYANDCLRVGDAGSGIVDVDGGREHVQDVVEKVKSLTTYLLGRVEEGMHAKIVNTLMSKNADIPQDGRSLASFVIEIARRAEEKDRVRDAVVLATVLQHLFSDTTKEDADLWLGFARKLERTAPQTAIAILASITAYAPEPPKLDRYRNELAASLIGVRPSAASTTGLITLRLLAATAPDPDSDVVFLPQQRAVNVMKACQTWVAADDDEDDDEGVNEDVESAMTLIFLHLAPILQNVPGSHWDFIWDVIDNNLENCSLEDSATLTTLGRTVKLVMAIDDLASTNKPLRANWEERKSTVLTLVRDIVAVNTGTMPYSEPRAVCRELAMSVIQDMPSTLMSEKTLSSMCHLLGNQSQDVQRTGYHLLHNAARKLTEHYVIEAGVDTEDAVKPELPAELVAALQQTLGSGDAVDLDDQSTARNKEVSGYLLAWMITFDLFIDASLKVRSGYFNHMRSLNIISQHFIPNVFDVLGLFSGGKRVFKLDVWAVDEFHLDTFEPENPLSFALLAAHLYHRALLTVPALIRSWISDCTDKQLLTRVVEYTASYFSPGIIKAELALVRQPDASSELATTENLTVKVSPASGEVTASYMVDEQALELSIRMPSDWPLHRLEVRDTKMVGVSEDRWRAWVLGVQQVVWQQNGRIVDGLTLFTKNVTLHFAGQVECAICYSIISVMDASLPQKPCKTCKNRFHASCLYKWFKTSHSSSCPLCRSDIL